MPLTILNCIQYYKQKKFFSQNRLLLPSHQFATELPGSNFLPPTFSTGGKWDFQVANLLLATVNFKPCLLNKNSILFCLFQMGLSVKAGTKAEMTFYF